MEIEDVWLGRSCSRSEPRSTARQETNASVRDGLRGEVKETEETINGVSFEACSFSSVRKL